MCEVWCAEAPRNECKTNMNAQREIICLIWTTPSQVVTRNQRSGRDENQRSSCEAASAESVHPHRRCRASSSGSSNTIASSPVSPNACHSRACHVADQTKHMLCLYTRTSLLEVGTELAKSALLRPRARRLQCLAHMCTTSLRGIHKKRLAFHGTCGCRTASLGCNC